MSGRLVSAPLSIVYSVSDLEDERFEREYQLLSGTDDDPIGQWLKTAKAKGDTQDTDKILLELVVGLHRKIDALEMIIKDEVPKRVSLASEALITRIGFELFELEAGLLEVGKIYYGRIAMPVYPQRDVPVFFEAIDSDKGKILRIHERDQTEWNAYVTARERIMIREMKGLS